MPLGSIKMFGGKGWGAVNKRAASALGALLGTFGRLMGDGFTFEKVEEPLTGAFGADPAVSGASGAGCLKSFRIGQDGDALRCYMGYVPHNKAVSTLYDFTVWLPFDCGEALAAAHDDGRGFLEGLGEGNPLISDRVNSLGLLTSRIIKGEDGSLAEMRFMAGSFTWTAVPPVSSAVTFTETDCVRLVELIRMVAILLGPKE